MVGFENFDVVVRPQQGHQLSQSLIHHVHANAHVRRQETGRPLAQSLNFIVLGGRKACRTNDNGLAKVARRFQITHGSFRHRKINCHIRLSHDRQGIVRDLDAGSAAPHNLPDITAHGRMLRACHSTGEGELRVSLYHGDHPLPHPARCSCDNNPRQRLILLCTQALPHKRHLSRILVKRPRRFLAPAAGRHFEHKHAGQHHGTNPENPPFAACGFPITRHAPAPCAHTSS